MAPHPMRGQATGRIAGRSCIARISWLCGLGLLAAASAPAAEPAAQVQLNQLGHLPMAAKWAAVPVPASGPAPNGFRIVAAHGGREWLRGPLGEPADWAAAGQRLAMADFSALRRPGRYRLLVDGLPPSAAFEVRADLYQGLAATALKAFYFNRASTELRPEHAGPWARPAGHADTRVRVHASAASPGRPEGSLISAPKGWYDAGDYNKYIVNSGISMWTLLSAWEQFPQPLRRLSTGIPESGNGLPDVLDEVLWNLEWMLDMQDPDDGGVYHKLTNLRFDDTVMPHQATTERYVVAKGTAATLDFAAVMAQASRVLAPFEAQRPGLAARSLAAARRAWAWALAHPDLPYRQPPDVHTGGYDDDKLDDEWAWAAAELFVTTGEPAFWTALQARPFHPQVPGWADVGLLGWFSLAQHRHRLPAPADRALIEQRVQAAAEPLLARWRSSPQRLVHRGEDLTWGSNSQLLNQALVLLQAHRLGAAREALDAAQAGLDAVLGRNALAMSMVTGVGERSPRHPHHRPSQADGVAAPVPGFLVGGPNPGQHDAQYCPPYPSQPPALSYLDDYCSWASNEVTINWNAPLVYVALALQALTPSATEAAPAKPAISPPSAPIRPHRPRTTTRKQTGP